MNSALLEDQLSEVLVRREKYRILFAAAEQNRLVFHSGINSATAKTSCPFSRSRSTICWSTLSSATIFTPLFSPWGR